VLPSGTVKITCGPLVQGIQSAEFSLEAGQISGTVNGKTIIPAKAASALGFGLLKFSDGTAVPTVILDERSSNRWKT
jgi:hypothetical protein